MSTIKPIEKTKCFDHTIWQSRCDESLYKDSNLESAIDMFVKNMNTHNPTAGAGDLDTTVDTDFTILNFPSAQPLVEWIISQITSVDEFNFKNSSTFTFSNHF